MSIQSPGSAGAPSPFALSNPDDRETGSQAYSGNMADVLFAFPVVPRFAGNLIFRRHKSDGIVDSSFRSAPQIQLECCASVTGFVVKKIHCHSPQDICSLVTACPVATKRTTGHSYGSWVRVATGRIPNHHRAVPIQVTRSRFETTVSLLLGLCRRRTA